MVNIDIIYIVVTLFCALLGIGMLFSKSALTCALCLLGILLGTASIYALQGAHLIATLQLVVYAGAIMVLFVFSIMLLNSSQIKDAVNIKSPKFILGMVSVLVVVAVGTFAFTHLPPPTTLGEWNTSMITQNGGNTVILAHSLFTEHYIAFEAVSVALLVAIIGAVTLAKRKVN